MTLVWNAEIEIGNTDIKDIWHCVISVLLNHIVLSTEEIFLRWNSILIFNKGEPLRTNNINKKQ